MNFEGISEFDRTHFILHPANKALVEEFEKKLAGKKGEFALLFYTTAQGNFFRYGRLEGEELIWDDQALVTLPIGEFVVGREGAWKKPHALTNGSVTTHKANIFSQRVAGLGHYPTLLCNYIVGEDKTHPSVKPRPSALEVFIGDDEANKYFTAHEHMDMSMSPFMQRLMRGEHLDEHFLEDAEP